MIEAIETDIESDLLRAVEREARQDLNSDIRKNRSALLRWLRTHIADPNHELSIGELIIAAHNGGKARVVGPMLLRLYSAGILPEVESSNEVGRNLLSLAENSQPDLLSYLRFDAKAQTFQKIKLVGTAHNQICEFLSPLATPFNDLDAALNARKAVLGALNHSLVQKYAAAFDLKVVKVTVEDLFHRLKLVHGAGATLLVDVEASKKSIADARQIIAEGGSFLAQDFLRPLVGSFERALGQFLKTSRARFTTNIRPRFTSELVKRFPLHDVSRVIQVSVPFFNEGPGLALDVRISVTNESDALLLSNRVVHLGNVPPGNFALTLDAQVIEAMPDARLTILMEWGEIGEPSRKSDAFDLVLKAQSPDVDWAAHEYRRPYTTEPAQGEDFIGREEKVKALASKLLKFPMESFYITGQKRVGKTSLALAAVEFAIAHAKDCEIRQSYNLWGSFAHEDARQSLRALGKSLEALIRQAVPELSSQSSLELNGSLAELVTLSELAYRLRPTVRFVVVIDEFDEIHQELYLHGNLAETFFANLRALSRSKNVCLVMVGGENIPYVMERQGQKLNNFARVSLSYYDRSLEWGDFRSMVQTPTAGIVHWHDDAVTEIFNFSNGNPFFAKIICAEAFEIAIKDRDTNISNAEIKHSNERMISTLGANSFAHLWQDGIPKPPTEREVDILIRTRVLVALARCYQRGDPPTISNVFGHRGSLTLSEAETSAVLRDFVRRDVLSESSGLFAFKLPIFQTWLLDSGAAQLAADSLTEELASAQLQEELAAVVKSEEISALVRSWPTYRGRHLGVDDVRAWLQQVENAKDQRLLFEILQRVRFFNEGRIREMLKSSFSFLHPLPEFVIKRRSDRRKNIIVTYVDGEGKSGQSCASMFAEENMISGECIFPPADFNRRISQHRANGGEVDSIVIVDDFIGTGRSLLVNVSNFIANSISDLKPGVPVRVIALTSTIEGQKHVLAGLGRVGYENVDLRVCEVLSSESFAFSEGDSNWSCREDADRAKALCVDLGRRVYKRNPLGYGDLGLLLVFPTNTPNNSLPIIHGASRAGSGSWNPLFERITH